MKRRSFLKSSLAPLVATSTAVALPAVGGAREYYELRTYTLKPDRKARLDDYLGKAFIPALKRLGLGPVGVFSEAVAGDVLTVQVLIVANSVETLATLGARLAADEEYAKAAADYLSAPAADPIYDRIESSLLGAIEGLPHIATPDTGKSRILNLRIYESHNERAAAKKIEMFNKHELAIFQRVGLTPVIFGEALVGAHRPNLTYMLVFPDDGARQAAWKTFGADPDWKALKAIPEYADKEIVLKITNKILTPEPYSEI